MIRALIFDLDGLLVDTEGPYFAAWQDVYAARGGELTKETLPRWIGTTGGFDPVAYLGEQIGAELDDGTIRAEQRERFEDRLGEVVLRPGVGRYLDEAGELELKTAVASNSKRDWVHGFLGRLQVADRFDVVRCRDDVGVHKPDPAVYLSALEALGVDASEAVAFEDSPMGLLSAKRAGLVCVAVPNALTEVLPMDDADLVLTSLEDLSLRDLLRRVGEVGR